MNAIMFTPLSRLWIHISKWTIKSLDINVISVKTNSRAKVLKDYTLKTNIENSLHEINAEIQMKINVLILQFQFFQYVSYVRSILFSNASILPHFENSDTFSIKSLWWEVFELSGIITQEIRFGFLEHTHKNLSS